MEFFLKTGCLFMVQQTKKGKTDASFAEQKGNSLCTLREMSPNTCGSFYTKAVYLR